MLLGEPDQRDGQILSEVDLSPIAYPHHPTFALTYWRGDFFVFMGAFAALHTTVWRYRPSDGSKTRIADLDDIIVGVGRALCTPAEL